ncbi:hypothetical protein TWF481_006268 [Arthrobotrys musiformis]|uniref:Uncharacterized protein n=1 Tax=Arthrobotrys musiformis TaxID=47236 RepID=A0AAV9WHD2_9PEZI
MDKRTQYKGPRNLPRCLQPYRTRKLGPCPTGAAATPTSRTATEGEQPSSPTGNPTSEESGPESTAPSENSDQDADENEGFEEKKKTKMRALLFILEFQRLYEINSKIRRTGTRGRRPPAPRASNSEKRTKTTDELKVPCDSEIGAPSGSSPSKYCEAGPSTASDRSQSSENLGAAPSNTEFCTPNKSFKRRRKRDRGEGNDEGEDEDPSPPQKRPKKKDLISLGGKLACPFAKGDPDNHQQCLAIGRQNLSGIKPGHSGTMATNTTFGPRSI